ncbi:MAG: YHS domain-containing protein [Candidatus Rokuibacteriota bacterium]|jgi:Cu+-exporting ATPase
MAKDLVCGMEVDEKKPAATAAYQGKTYFFCAPGCKATFLKTPEKYVKSEKSGKGCCA